MLHSKINRLLLISFILFGVLNFTYCSQEDNTDNNSKISLSLDKTTITSDASSQFIEIKSSESWKVSISFPEGTGAWCALSGKTEGTGNAFITLRNYANADEQERIATIVLDSGNERVMVEIVQLGRSSDKPLPKPTSPETWLELPENVVNHNCQTITHYTNISNKEVRNFTVYYDTVEKMAYWVAYPLHRSYIGNSGRSDAWALDPILPQWAQPNLLNGFGKGYDRGHQIPSGDRTIDRSTNSHTFYFTNMTAQNSTLNQGVWAKLEAQCRTWMAKYDTLYVTTGAILKTKGGSETWIKKKESSVPNFYYKVLLGKKGSTYKSIGFWFQNKSYPDNKDFITYAKSVRQIENLTGFNFFANLPKEIQDEVEVSFKAQDWGL